MSFISWFRMQPVQVDDELITRAELDKRVLEKNLEDAKLLETDLVEAGYFLGCCSECAKRRGRVFSLSGEDKRFPKFEREYGCTCQGIGFTPISDLDLEDDFFNVSTFINKPVDIIQYSNRPFIDDRTDSEKKIYEMFVKECEANEWYEPYGKRLDELNKETELQYDWICKNMPEYAPKSKYAFFDMKEINSVEFQKISKLAEDKGKIIYYTNDELAELEIIKPIRAKYSKIIGECMQFRYGYK